LPCHGKNGQTRILALKCPEEIRFAITIRDSFPHEEKCISTARIFYGEEIIPAGCKDVEATHLGSDLMNELPVLLLYNVDPAWPPEDIAVAADEAERLASSMRALGHPVADIAVHDSDLARCLKPYDPAEWIVFNWCEELPGMPHSDARVARILEEHGFTCTGPSSESLRLSWDKAWMKRLLNKRRLPTPRWRLYASAGPARWNRFPAIAKPSQEHSSFGVTTEAVVQNAAELRARIAYILDEFKQPALVEDFIDGREFHVSLWGNSDVRMLPVAEMDFSRFDQVQDRLCTYESKFHPGSRHYEDIGLLLPAPLRPMEQERLYRTLKAAYRSYGCRDFARMDVRLRDGTFYILDINPNPDISSDASMACAAEVAGLSFGDMGSFIIRLAAARHPVFSGRRTAYAYGTSLPGFAC
jgi:D-alanine-D-alanine ligase